MAKIRHARVTARNEVVLPPQLARHLGLSAGDEIRVEPNGSGVCLRPSVHSLRRVYVEPTNRCNLTCSTCMRNVWDVQYGDMSDETYRRLLSGLEAFPEKPELFLGGYGEPLAHPDLIGMLELAKSRGYRVTLITNGILLTAAVVRCLIDLGLDMLWVSLDGASPECYADVRLGDALPQVIGNLAELRKQKFLRFGVSNWAGLPRLGIAFVAMRRNIHDLGEVVRLGSRLGAVEFSVSNVLAHNAELLQESLYLRSLDLVAGQEIRPMVHLPLMDIDPHTVLALTALLKDMNRMEFAGGHLNRNTESCPFVERGSLSVRWDGKLSPCLPLLYTHTHYLDQRERTSREHFVGDLHAADLAQAWNDGGYRELRERLRDFDFSPCVYCNSCEMAGGNMEDCFGNLQPACGGCLWARGLIRCP